VNRIISDFDPILCPGVCTRMFQSSGHWASCTVY